MMSSTPASAEGPPIAAPGPARDSSIRRFGYVLFPLVLAEGALGVVSASSNLSGPSVLLTAHVGFGVGLVGLTIWALVSATRFPRRAARLVTGFTTLAVLATGLTGALFLLTGFSQGADIDRGLALVSLAGTVLMIVWGTAPVSPGAGSVTSAS